MSNSEKSDKNPEMLENNKNLESFKTFYENLESLEKEVSNLKAIREAYNKVSDLSEDYEKIKVNLGKALGSLQEAIVDLKQLKLEVEASTEKQITLINERFDTIQSKLNEEFIELKKLIDEKSETINESNKKFYKEFTDTVQIRLDNHKGEIKQLIEHERSEIKNMFDKQTDLIEKSQDKRNAEQEKRIKQVKTIGLCFGIGIATICVIDLILSFFH